MAAVLEYPIEINQNETYGPQNFWFFGPDPSGLGNVANQVPVNFTGATVKLTVRQAQSSSSTSLLALTTSSGIALTSGTTTPGPPVPSFPNGFSVTITPTQASSLSPGQYYYDALVTFSGGVQTYYLSGPFTVLATVAR